jgi:hypothetical protein
VPRRREGDAFVEFHADTTAVESEAERGIRRAAENIERDDLPDIGEDFGEVISKSMGKEFEKQGPALARSIEDGLGRQKVRTRVSLDLDKDNNVLKRTVERIIDDVEGAFDSASTPGGPFNRIGRGISDAIGAGFNVSGRSPLIALLVPLVGVIIALVAGALQAVNGLIAALATLPALLGGIALQVGTIAIAFQGVGEAVKGAFAAKNAKELNEALKELTPSARNFVRELLPLRGFFDQLRRTTQESFFANLGSIIPQLQKALGPTLISGFRDLAAALGGLFRDLALFFASPGFVTFVQKLFPATIEFLKFFGPNFIKFLDGLVKMSTAILPFLNTLGRMLGGTLFQIGDFFERMSRSPKFLAWLDSMNETLESLLELFTSVIDFVAIFLAQLDAAGGRQILDELVEAVQMLSFVLSSPIGQKAMEGLIRFAMIAIDVFTGLVIVVFGILAGFEAVSEFIIGVAIPATVGWLKFLGESVLWLFNTVGGALLWFFDKVGGAIIAAWDWVVRFFTGSKAEVSGFITALVQGFNNLPERLLAVVRNAYNSLRNAGRALVQNLIDGAMSMLGPLENAFRGLMNRVAAFLPGSPAEEGPLSGQGYSLYRGQRLMEDFAKGIRMEAPTIQDASNEATSNIVFGRDSIRVTFEGALPTQEQATQTGSAVGAGINRQLAVRDTRLAVRTL